MDIQELKYYLLRGKMGILPGWSGYIKWDYAKGIPYFVNEDWKTYDLKIYEGRKDLYYII